MNEKIVDDVEDALPTIRLEMLKTILHLVQQELSRRKENGNAKTVTEVLALALRIGWKPGVSGDVVTFIERKLKERT